MEREDFVRVDGFEEVIERLKSGKGNGVNCNNCPFSIRNSTNGTYCSDIYVTGGFGKHNFDLKLQQSATEFENKFIIRTPSLESIMSKLTEAEVDYIKNNPEAFDNKGFEVLNGVGKVVNSGKLRSTYEDFINKYNIENWWWGRQLPYYYPTIDFKVIGRGEHEQGNDLIYVIEHDNKTWLIGEEGLEWKELVQIKMGGYVSMNKTDVYHMSCDSTYDMIKFNYINKKTFILHNISAKKIDLDINNFNKELRQFGFEVVM